MKTNGFFMIVLAVLVGLSATAIRADAALCGGLSQDTQLTDGGEPSTPPAEFFPSAMSDGGEGDDPAIPPTE
jgi:hypothetical protein